MYGADGKERLMRVFWLIVALLVVGAGATSLVSANRARTEQARAEAMRAEADRQREQAQAALDRANQSKSSPGANEGASAPDSPASTPSPEKPAAIEQPSPETNAQSQPATTTPHSEATASLMGSDAAAPVKAQEEEKPPAAPAVATLPPATDAQFAANEETPSQQEAPKTSESEPTPKPADQAETTTEKKEPVSAEPAVVPVVEPPASSTPTSTPTTTPAAPAAATPPAADNPAEETGPIPAKFEKLDNGTLKVDDRFIVKGEGTIEKPYEVTWDHLISASEIYSPRDGKKRLPERVTMLDGKIVTVSGYIAFPMYVDKPRELLSMLNQWDGCCIGVPPTPFDAIEVRLKDPVEGENRYATQGTVTGKFGVKPYLTGDWLVGLYVMDNAVISNKSTAGSSRN